MHLYLLCMTVKQLLFVSWCKRPPIDPYQSKYSLFAEYLCDTRRLLDNQLHLKQPTGTTIGVRYNVAASWKRLDLLEIAACGRESAVARFQIQTLEEFLEPLWFGWETIILTSQDTTAVWDNSSTKMGGAAAPPKTRHHKNHQITTVYVSPLYRGVYVWYTGTRGGEEVFIRVLRWFNKSAYSLDSCMNLLRPPCPGLLETPLWWTDHRSLSLFVSFQFSCFTSVLLTACFLWLFAGCCICRALFHTYTTFN